MSPESALSVPTILNDLAERPHCRRTRVLVLGVYDMVSSLVQASCAVWNVECIVTREYKTARINVRSRAHCDGNSRMAAYENLNGSQPGQRALVPTIPAPCLKVIVLYDVY